MSDSTEPGDAPTGAERAEHSERSDSPARTNRSNERAARNNDRTNTDRSARTSDGGTRPARGNSDRPAYNSDRPARSGGDRSDRPAYNSDRPARSGGDRSDRPAYNSDRAARGGGDRPDRPARNSDRQPGRPGGSDRSGADRGGRPPAKKLWTNDGAPARNDRDSGARNAAANAAAAADWEDRDPFNTRSVRPRHDDPILPDDVTPDELDRVARNELKTLAKDNAEGVAQHLAMAARLIESDPATAHAHALTAARRAGRIGVVRETLAITAYAIGDYALALRELRTHRRITGRTDQLPLMVDCERALGRPDKALELARSVPKSSLPVAVQVELSIAMSGARLDQGQPEQALQEVTIAQLDPTKIFSWSPDLFAAYATCLEELGRESDAEIWWTHADTAAEALEEHNNGIDGETIDIFEDDFVFGEDGEDDVAAGDDDAAGSDEGTEVDEDAGVDEDTDVDAVTVVDEHADVEVTHDEARSDGEEVDNER